MYFPNILVKNKCLSESRRTNPQELKCWLTFCVNYFLRYYLMMQHRPIVKRVYGTHEWAHRPYQLLSAPYQPLITAACTNTDGKPKGSHSRAADRCPFVPKHSLSQVTSFMQLWMLWAIVLQCAPTSCPASGASWSISTMAWSVFSPRTAINLRSVFTANVNSRSYISKKCIFLFIVWILRLLLTLSS